MNHTSCKDTEIQFGRDDSPSETIVTAFADSGQVTITVQDTEVLGQACDNELSLGQAIQLRDFLNRHIDGLALASTGSLAVRSSDDPTQMASEEFIAAVQEGIADAEAGNLVSLDSVKEKWQFQPVYVPIAGCGKDLAHNEYHCGEAREGRGTMICTRCIAAYFQAQGRS